MWVLGAPEAVVDATGLASLASALGDHTSRGERVVVLCHEQATNRTGGLAANVPPRIAPVALVVLSERVKQDVVETLHYFAEQGITVKVLSGDNPATVAAVAARAGIVGAHRAVDATTLPTDLAELAVVVASSEVFGRVGPEQKRTIVTAVQHAGHTVAMTGDGVNDLLAMKASDVGIAMGQGSSATRSAAQFVLLDGGFAALPAVVAEGRRVIGNIERVAGLFLTKSVYALALSLATGVGRLPFPLLPRQLSLVGALSIGLPGFVLAMDHNATRAQRGFVRRVLATAIPAGLISAAATFAAYADARSDSATLAEARTTATVVLFVVAICLLALVARPWHRRRAALLGLLAGLFTGTIALPAARNYFEFAAPPATTWGTAAALGAAACAAMVAGHRKWSTFSERHTASA